MHWLGIVVCRLSRPRCNHLWHRCEKDGTHTHTRKKTLSVSFQRQGVTIYSREVSGRWDAYTHTEKALSVNFWTQGITIYGRSVRKVGWKSMLGVWLCMFTQAATARFRHLRLSSMYTIYRVISPNHLFKCFNVRTRTHTHTHVHAHTHTHIHTHTG